MAGHAEDVAVEEDGEDPGIRDLLARQDEQVLHAGVEGQPRNRLLPHLFIDGLRCILCIGSWGLTIRVARRLLFDYLAPSSGMIFQENPFLIGSAASLLLGISVSRSESVG